MKKTKHKVFAIICYVLSGSCFISCVTNNFDTAAAIISIIFLFIAIVLTVVYNFDCDRNAVKEQKKQIKNSKIVEFILNNSLAIKELSDVYNSLVLNDFNDVVFKGNYDNKNVYADLEPIDLLVYELNEDSKAAMDSFFIAGKNKQQWDKFLKAKDNCKLGRYQSVSKWSEDKLMTKENELIERLFVKPKTYTNVKVYINLVNLNGKRITSKNDHFDYFQVKDILDRLSNKKDFFFNDQTIWSSICKIERAKVTNKIRFEVYKRDHYKCQKCGKDCRDTNDLEIDHIIPISRGGTSDISNLQSLCHDCNIKKGTNE